MLKTAGDISFLGAMETRRATEKTPEPHFIAKGKKTLFFKNLQIKQKRREKRKNAERRKGGEGSDQKRRKKRSIHRVHLTGIMKGQSKNTGH